MKRKIRYNINDPFSVSIEPDEEKDMRDVVDEAIKEISDKKERVLSDALAYYDIPQTAKDVKENVQIRLDKDNNEQYYMKGELAVTISRIFAYEDDKAFINIEKHYLAEEVKNEDVQ